MNSEQITAFLQEHWYIASVLIGAVILIGAIRNWNWQEESTCPLEKVKTEDGWADEIMAHMIRCKHCGQIFTCVVNTWRGSEHFRKGKG